MARQKAARAPEDAGMGTGTSWRRRGLACVLACGLAACTSLPGTSPDFNRAYTSTAQTRLGQAVQAQAALHPAQAGVQLLPQAGDAFAARYLLALSAERSIDVQYHAWRPDASGILLAAVVWQAAERGVRVRILLDDLHAEDLDPLLAALDRHPNIRVRLFNPLTYRSWRVAERLLAPHQLKQRMFNRMWVVDNQFAVVGDRNVEDLFLSDTGGAVEPMDVMLAGPVVPQISAGFDSYWNSKATVPVSDVIAPAADDALEAIVGQMAERAKGARGESLLAELSGQQQVRDLLAGTRPLAWGSVQWMVDAPGKVLALEEADDTAPLMQQVETALGRPVQEFLLLAPDAAWRAADVARLAELAAAGAQVVVLTNSLAAADSCALHATYVRQRKDLLRAGVRVFERKAGDAPAEPAVAADPAQSQMMVADRRNLLLGPYLRDADRDAGTDAALFVQAPALARQAADSFTRATLQAYEVRLDGDGEEEWVEYQEGARVTHRHAPGASVWRRLWLALLGFLPLG